MYSILLALLFVFKNAIFPVRDRRQAPFALTSDIIMFFEFIICSLNWQRDTASNSGYIYSVFSLKHRQAAIRTPSCQFQCLFHLILDQDGLEILLCSVGVHFFFVHLLLFVYHFVFIDGRLLIQSPCPTHPSGPEFIRR